MAYLARRQHPPVILLSSWGITTDTNKWWREGTGFTANFEDYDAANDYLVALIGIGDNVGITLSVACETGEIVQVYS